MALQNEETENKENCIEFVRGEKTAYVTFSSRRFANKVKKLAETCEDVKIISENDGGYLYATVPVEYISIRKPRTLTEEQKQEARERMESRRSENGKMC